MDLRRVRPHSGEGNSKTAKRFHAIQGGLRADSRGKWAVEHLISARRAGKRQFEVLVRWAGEHPDTWENPSRAFGDEDLADPTAIGIRSKRRRVLRYARAALGPLYTPLPTLAQLGRRNSSRLLPRFKRLLRGRDVLRARLRGRRRTCPSKVAVRKDVASHFPESGVYGEAERETTGDGHSIVLEELEDTDARPDPVPRKSPRFTLKRPAEHDSIGYACKRTRFSTRSGGARRPPVK